MSTPQYCTYLYYDPKTHEPVYVGKGSTSRPKAHFTANTHLGRMLRKRTDEGFKCAPTVIYTESESTAFMLERFWIAVIGRKDLGLGSLFNNTDGGQGPSGRIMSEAEKSRRALRQKEVWSNPELKARQAERQRLRWTDPEQREHTLAVQNKRWSDPVEIQKASERQKRTWAKRKGIIT